MAIRRTGRIVETQNSIDVESARNALLTQLETYLTDLIDVEQRDARRYRSKKDADYYCMALAKCRVLNAVRAWVRVNL